MINKNAKATATMVTLLTIVFVKQQKLIALNGKIWNRYSVPPLVLHALLSNTLNQ